MKIKSLLAAAESAATVRKQSIGRAKFTEVNTVDYFHFLNCYEQEALSDSESYEAWTNYHTGRGETRRVRKLHLRKLLEKHDERGRY